MEDSQIRVAQKEGIAFIEIVGRGSFLNAGLLKAFYKELLKTKVEEFVVNLDACTSLDSTFLGTLTGLGMALKQKGAGHLYIINAHSRNVELLKNLGLDRLFNVNLESNRLEAPPNFKKINSSDCSPVADARDVLDAHLNLIKCDSENKSRFKDVIAYLKEDLGLTGLD